MKVKGMISEAPPRSSLTEGAPQRSGEGSWAEERGGEGGGCYSSRMEMGEEAVFKTAGFRVRDWAIHPPRTRVCRSMAVNTLDDSM